MCLRPITMDGRTFPCSKCSECLKRKGSEWSHRLVQHDRVAMSSYFITFTYDGNTVPLSKYGHYWTLDRKAIPGCVKRMRAEHERRGLYDLDNPIKYFAVGEYGSKRNRPHYHVLFFNVELDALFSREDLIVLDATGFDGKTHVFCKQWNFGHCTVGKVSAASVGYCLKYMLKTGKVGKVQGDDRVPEFRLMSKGLGVSYLTPGIMRWHRDDLTGRMYVPIEDGKKIAMCRYFKDKLYSAKERELLKEFYAAMMIEKYIETVKYFDDPVLHMKHVKDRCGQAFRKMKNAESTRMDF